MEIKNSVVVITGGASGIGAAAAEGLARMGAMVVLGDMNEQRLEEVGGRIRDQGFQVRWKSLNVTVEQEVQAFMDFAFHEFGKINLVLASAGIARDSFFVTPDKETGKVKKIHDNGPVATGDGCKPYRCFPDPSRSGDPYGRQPVGRSAHPHIFHQ